MRVIDKIAMITMLLSMTMLDSDTYIPYLVCLVSVIYLLVRVVRGELDV